MARAKYRLAGLLAAGEVWVSGDLIEPDPAGLYTLDDHQADQVRRNGFRPVMVERIADPPAAAADPAPPATPPVTGA